MTAPPEKESARILARNEQRECATPVDEVQRRIGKDAVLLHCPPDTKGPRSTGWQDTTPDQMREPSYLTLLNRGNIAVLLGKVSGGLCSIDIDSDADADAFLALNPKLQASLRTRRVRGCNVWVRIVGDYPKAEDLLDATGRHFGEWRCDERNTMIYGQAIDPNKGETEPTRY